MIGAGFLDRVITLQHLKIERTETGATKDEWIDEVTVKCRVITPSLGDRRTQLTNEVIITDNLTFQTRKIYAKHFNRYSGLKHRIKYFNPKSGICRLYQILSIDDETDDLFIMGQLIDE
jgi:hypothetical protein